MMSDALHERSPSASGDASGRRRRRERPSARRPHRLSPRRRAISHGGGSRRCSGGSGRCPREPTDRRALSETVSNETTRQAKCPQEFREFREHVSRHNPGRQTSVRCEIHSGRNPPERLWLM